MPKKGVQQLTCRVCGDNSIAFNFGVESCESCKAFFRRNALKNRGFVCKYGGNCEVDVTRRRFCRSCRLQKCFAVGMKKDYILTDEQKSQRKFLTKENRKKRDDNNNNKLQNILDFEGIEGFEDSLDFEGMEMFDNWRDFDDQMVPIFQTINTYNKNLNEMEISRLGELLNAAELIRDPVSKITAEPKDLDVILATYGFKMDLELRRLPVMCKHLSAFSTICEEDKYALVKAGCLEIITMRSLIAYNNDNQYWTIILDADNTSVVRLETLKFISENFYKVSKDFFTKYGGEWDLDSIILDLLTAIALFNADRPNIIHKPVIKLYQQMYIFLLKRYLGFKYNEWETNEKFSILMHCLCDLKNFSNFDRKIPENCVYKPPPLVCEVYDLEH